MSYMAAFFVLFFWFENSNKNIFVCFVVMGCVCVFSRVVFCTDVKFVTGRGGLCSVLVFFLSRFFVFVCFSDFLLFSNFSGAEDCRSAP